MAVIRGHIIVLRGVQQPYYNAMLLSGQVPYEAIMEMIEHSYETVVKKPQRKG